MSETMMIPPGYYFVPTDRELITSYLLRKAMGLPLPWKQILEKDLYGENADPWDVLSDVDESHWHASVNREEKEFKHVKRVIYVFTRLSKINGKTRIARTAGCGTWEGQTGARDICNESGQLIGFMKMLTFKAKKGSGDNTRQRDHWIMHEYSLAGISLNCELKYKDYVICRITRSSKEKYGQQPIPRFSDRGYSISSGEKQFSHENELGKKRSAADVEEIQEDACYKKQARSSTEPEGKSILVLAHSESSYGVSNDDNSIDWMSADFVSRPSLSLEDLADFVFNDDNSIDCMLADLVSSPSLGLEDLGVAPLQDSSVPVDGCLMPQQTSVAHGRDSTDGMDPCLIFR